MHTHTKKRFGVWMDGQHATVTGNAGTDPHAFAVLGHVKNPGAANNSSEKAANHEAVALTRTFFKEIAALMPNIDEIHVSGTGQVQEQFIHFLADTPQYKNAVSTESTSNKMSDEQLVTFFEKHFH